MPCYLAKDEIIKESLSGGDKPWAVGEIPLPHPVSQVVSPQGLHVHPWSYIVGYIGVMWLDLNVRLYLEFSP